MTAHDKTITEELAMASDGGQQHHEDTARGTEIGAYVLAAVLVALLVGGGLIFGPVGTAIVAVGLAFVTLATLVVLTKQ